MHDYLGWTCPNTTLYDLNKLGLSIGFEYIEYLKHAKFAHNNTNEVGAIR